jgi:HK97 family phage major capsid protein
MNKHQRDLEAVELKMTQIGEKAQELTGKLETEDRHPSDAEKTQIDEWKSEKKSLADRKADIQKEIELDDELRSLSRGIKVTTDEADKKDAPAQAKSLGRQFVESDQYQGVKSREFRGEWRTGEVTLDAKAFLGEGAIDDAEAANGSVLVQPQVQAGILPIAQEELTIADLIPSGTASGNSIKYLKETVAENKADTVKEGGTKPESKIAFDDADVSIRKIATVLQVSDEMLEDQAAIASYINARLTLFVRQTEEDQLLNGTNTSPDLNGILRQIPEGNKTVAATAAFPNAADAVWAAMMQVKHVSLLDVSGIVMNPVDYADLRTVKDENGQYLAGGPFSNSAQPIPTLWGKPVVLTSKITEGSALVGAFSQAAQIFRNGGLTVEATNAHAENFTKNITAIRAESRLGLAVYRPQAFATADLTVGS